MSGGTARSREQMIAEYTRQRQLFWRSAIRMGTWGALSYAFVVLYAELYGSQPVVVERLGTTLAVLCGVIAGCLLAGAVFTGSIALIHRWRSQRGPWA